MRLGVIALILTALAARADGTPEADAEAAAARGDYMTAAAKFREAFAADPRPELICNVGVAFYKAKDLPRAQRYLDQCLDIGTNLDPAFIENVTKVEKAVVDKLGAGDFTPVDLVISPTSAAIEIEGGVPFDEPIASARRIWLPFGHYKLVARAPGFVDSRTEVDARDHYAQTVKVTLQAVPPQPVQPTKQVVPPKLVTRGPSKTPAIIATSITGALLVGTVVSQLKASSLADDAGSSKLPDEYADRRDDAISWRNRTRYLGVATGVAALATGYLWYRVVHGRSRVEVQATASATHAGVTLTGAW